MSEPRISRNEPCPCGSGRKYKQCCGALTGGNTGTRPAAPQHPVDELIASALQHYGNGDLPAAETLLRELLEQDRNHYVALHLLGTLCFQTGRKTDALELVQRSIASNGQNPLAYHHLGSFYMADGNVDKAICSFRKAIELKSDLVDSYVGLGKLLLGKFADLEEAFDCFRRAVALAPKRADIHNALGLVSHAKGDYGSARASFVKAISLKSDFVEAHFNLGIALRDLGQNAEAATSYRRALAIKPDHAMSAENLLFLLAYTGEIPSGMDYLSEACRFEQIVLTPAERNVAAGRRFFPQPLDGRRLKIGYVSGDFRQHAVSYFLTQLFANHTRTRVELFAYSTNDKEDPTTERFKPLVDHWTQVADLSDDDCRNRIETDSIDVLVDLSGHTADNRLGVFARRAAPVQAHYLGYFASTGLSEMDYWIGDAVLTPPETDAHFSEQVWRLPRVWISYEGKAEAPAPRWQAADDGKLRIGSFNSLKKLTPRTFALWARILLALPEATLLLKAKELADQANRTRVLETLGGFGIAAGRIELADWTTTPGWAEHMAYYHRLDVALDPVGAIGSGTTACDALWMGVPLVALEGDRMASRMSNSMLHSIGHPEWVARDEDDYVNKVVGLAGDPQRRKAIRLSLRQEMATSPLCDAKGLARALEDAYFQMFAQSTRVHSDH